MSDYGTRCRFIRDEMLLDLADMAKYPEKKQMNRMK